MKKYIFWGSLLMLIVAAWMFWGTEKKVPEDVRGGEAVVRGVSAPQVIEALRTETPVVLRDSVATSSLGTPLKSKHTDALLFVGSKEYPISLTQDKTLLGVMKQLSQTTDFRYAGKDFSGLGFFVESINGKKSEGGMYWILYVNGVLAGEGVSQLVVNPGDNIEWRYEAEK